MNSRQALGVVFSKGGSLILGIVVGDAFSDGGGGVVFSCGEGEDCWLKSESDLSKSNKPKLSIIKKSPFSQISRKLLAKTS